MLRGWWVLCIVKSYIFDYVTYRPHWGYLRTYPSEGLNMSTCMQSLLNEWFAQADSTTYHLYVKCITVSSGKHREVMHFWLGCAGIEVTAGHLVALRDNKVRVERGYPCFCSGQLKINRMFHSSSLFTAASDQPKCIGLLCIYIWGSFPVAHSILVFWVIPSDRFFQTHAACCCFVIVILILFWWFLLCLNCYFMYIIR